MRDIPCAEWNAFLDTVYTCLAVEEPADADEDSQIAVLLTGGEQHFVVRLEREPSHS